jgi:ABC-2 type transport system permease protein
MRNIFLIARREYLERVHTKAFLVSLILFPCILALALAVPAYFATHDNGKKNLIVVTSDAALGQALTQELAAAPGPDWQHLTLMQPTPELRAQLNAQVESKQIEGYLWLPSPDTPSANTKLSYIASSAGDLNRVHHLQELLQHAQAREQLTQRGMTQQQIQSIFAPVHISIIQLSHGKSSSGFGTYAASIVLMFMLYASLMMQGVAVSQSVVEEKSSRIFEVMLSVLTPQEMLAGKLLGVGAVGLTQMGIWLLAGLFLTGPGLAGLHASGGAFLHLSPWNLIAFIVCFLLGFLFYSALSAMLGSMVNSNQEAQQLSPFVTMPLILSVVLFQVVLSDPSGRVATVLSLLPPFAPVLMYLRIAVQTPPMWQIALSLVLMLCGVWMAVWMASRIYRVGILMYGKRPTLPELMRWLRYS